MRYREGEDLPLAAQASDDMLLLTAILGFLIGFILAYLGKRGKQLWMRVWGYGLVVASAWMGYLTWSNLN